MTERLLVLAGLVLGAALCLHASTAEQRVPLRLSLDKLPATMGQWHAARQVQLDADTLAVLHADDYLSRTYVRQTGQEADLYIGYYESQRQGDTIHSPMNCLPAAGWQLLTLNRAEVDAGRRFVVNRDTIQKGLDQRLVLYWYESHGRAVASEYATKAYLVLDGLRLHRTDGALVRVITPIVHGERAAEANAVDFVRQLMPNLERHWG